MSIEYNIDNFNKRDSFTKEEVIQLCKEKPMTEMLDLAQYNALNLRDGQFTIVGGRVFFHDNNEDILLGEYMFNTARGEEKRMFIPNQIIALSKKIKNKDIEI